MESSRIWNRRAIVTDEDATLVNAGAGTGKTSTIVGKVDYLLRRGLARPEEILVLAFGKKAQEAASDRAETGEPEFQGLTHGRIRGSSSP